MRTIRGWIRIVLGITLMIGWSIGTAVGAQRQLPDSRFRYRARRQRKGAQLFCKALGLRVAATGPVPAEGQALYVSNHITALDPVLIGTQVEVSFAGKMEITGWPVLGWIANTHGIIGVERSRRSSAREFVKAIRNRLDEGMPVMVFPEGGIGWGDTLLSFKTGAFEAIANTDRGRVQPVYLDIVAVDDQPTPRGEGLFLLSYNHHDTLFGHLAHMLSFDRLDVEVRFGPPVPAASLKRKALADQAHAAVVRLQHQKHSCNNKVGWAT